MLRGRQHPHGGPPASKEFARAEAGSYVSLVNGTRRHRGWVLKKNGRVASYLCLPLLLPFCSALDSVGIARLRDVAPMGIRDFTIRPLWVHISASLKKSGPGHAVDVEAAVVTAAGPAVEAGALAHKQAR